MQLTQSITQTIESVYRRLDYEQPLRCRLDLALPAINRFNLRNDVDAGRQLPLNQRMGDAPGFFERTASGKNKPFVGHIKSVVSNRRFQIREFKFHSKHTRQPMATQIKFGTSGWRAVMAEEFTFANVNRAVHGIARYVSSQKSNGAKAKSLSVAIRASSAKLSAPRPPAFCPATALRRWSLQSPRPRRPFLMP